MGQAPVVAVLNFALRCGQGPPGGLLVVRLGLQLPRPGRRALAHVVMALGDQPALVETCRGDL